MTLAAPTASRLSSLPPLSPSGLRVARMRLVSRGIHCAGTAPRRHVPAVYALPESATDAVDAVETTNTAKAVRSVALFAAAVLLTSSLNVDDALAARSGGRVGGSSFSSARRMRAAPPPRAAGPSSSGSVRNYNYDSAPPLVSPYGFGVPFFGGGIVAPFPFFGIGSLFNIMILLFMVNVAFSVVSNFTNKGGDGAGGRGKEDRWDDDDERW
jgi:uncharacterized membrane protein